MESILAPPNTVFLLRKLVVLLQECWDEADIIQVELVLFKCHILKMKSFERKDQGLKFCNFQSEVEQMV